MHSKLMLCDECAVSPERPDSITLEVVRHRLPALADEMAAALRRSARSTRVKTRADRSCALFNRRLQTVAQASPQLVHFSWEDDRVRAPRLSETAEPRTWGPATRS